MLRFSIRSGIHTGGGPENTHVPVFRKQFIFESKVGIAWCNVDFLGIIGRALTEYGVEIPAGMWYDAR